MRFDAEGHLSITPRQLLGLAYADRRRLIDHYLIVGTPSVLPTYASYYDFLKSVSERIGVHPRNLVLRGSAQIGFVRNVGFKAVMPAAIFPPFPVTIEDTNRNPIRIRRQPKARSQDYAGWPFTR